MEEFNSVKSRGPGTDNTYQYVCSVKWDSKKTKTEIRE